MTAWQRIESGDLTQREVAALRAVAAEEPVVPCRIRHNVEWSTLRDLALAGLIAMCNNGSGEVCNPLDIEQAVTGGWLGVHLEITEKTRPVLNRYER